MYVLLCDVCYSKPADHSSKYTRAVVEIAKIAEMLTRTAGTRFALLSEGAGTMTCVPRPRLSENCRELPRIADAVPNAIKKWVLFKASLKTWSPILADSCR